MQPSFQNMCAQVNSGVLYGDRKEEWRWQGTTVPQRLQAQGDAGRQGTDHSETRGFVSVARAQGSRARLALREG